MHPDWLSAFVAVVDHRSFAGASRALRRAQPTVHLQVQKLAEHLNTTLYVRAGRGIALTAEGQSVAAFARETLARNASFERRLAGRTETRPAVLAAGEGAFLYLLDDAVRGFRQNSKVGLQLHVTDVDPTADVLEGRADVAVTTHAPVPDVEAATLARCRLAVALPRRHRLARRDHLTFSDLAEARFVTAHAGRPLRALLEREAHHAGFVPDIGVEARGWPLTLHFVRLGVGVALVNDVVRPPPGVVLRPLEGPAGPVYTAIRRRTRSHRPAAEALWAAVTAGR